MKNYDNICELVKIQLKYVRIFLYSMSSVDPSVFNGIPNSLYCPVCQTKTRINYNRGTSNHDDTYFFIARCIDCNRLTFIHCKEKQKDKKVKFVSPSYTIDVDVIFMYPLTSETKINDIPEKVAKSYLEGVRCLDSNSSNGAVAMFRRALQQICVEKGAIPKDRLVDQLKVLSSDLMPTIVEIKAWGNLGVHEDSDGIIIDVSKEQADAIKRFLEHVFLVTYQHPAEIARLKKTRSP